VFVTHMMVDRAWARVNRNISLSHLSRADLEMLDGASAIHINHQCGWWPLLSQFRVINPNYLFGCMWLSSFGWFDDMFRWHYHFFSRPQCDREHHHQAIRTFRDKMARPWTKSGGLSHYEKEIGESDLTLSASVTRLLTFFYLMPLKPM